jgi:outer membrane protein assembly factor BamD (BamD/ComL family)
MWTHKLKIAIATENIAAIARLSNELPSFSSVEQMQEAAYLIQNALTFLNAQKASTATALSQIKKNLDFLQSSNNKPKSTFDIIS